MFSNIKFLKAAGILVIQPIDPVPALGSIRQMGHGIQMGNGAWLLHKSYYLRAMPHLSLFGVLIDGIQKMKFRPYGSYKCRFFFAGLCFMLSNIIIHL